MRKLILICEILVVSLIILKIAVAGGVLQKMMPDASVLDPSHAIANVSQKIPDAGPAHGAGDDALVKERKLVVSLAEKEKQLENRENAIKEEEKKLQALKGEIVTKIDTLKGLEGRLSGMLDTVKSAEDKRLRDLATVFEATAPAQAGPMLEKMDKKL